MRILTNHSADRAIDVLASMLSVDGRLDGASPSISLFALQALRDGLPSMSATRLMLPGAERTEQSLLGSEAERASRNQLDAQRLARECAAWLRAKAEIKSAPSGLQQAALISRADDGSPRGAMVGDCALTAEGLGLAPGDRLSLVQVSESGSEAQALAEWFERIWTSVPASLGAKDELLFQLGEIAARRDPALLYALTLHHLFAELGDALDEDTIVKTATGIRETVVWQKLFKFQRDGVIGAIDKLERLGGCIIADSVGLGKTFEALAIIKYYELRNDRVLVLAPKRLRDNWTLYRSNDRRNVLATDRFNFDVLNHTDLSRDSGRSGDIDLSHVNWGNYDLVVIDESHNFRNKASLKDRETRYDRLMRKVIREGVKTRVLMLSATPINNRLADLKNQIAFVTEGRDNALYAHGIPSIDTTVRLAQRQFNRWLELPAAERTAQELVEMLGFDYFKLLDLLTIARSRKHIEKYYGTAETGTFPVRLRPINHKPDVDRTGAFSSIREVNDEIRRLSLAVYAPLRYVLPGKRDAYDAKYSTQIRGGESFFRQTDREESLVALLRVNSLKRMESSVSSFALTVQRQLADIDATLARIESHARSVEELPIEEGEVDDPTLESLLVGGKVSVLLDDVDLARWKQDLLDDRRRLASLHEQASHVDASRDAKLAQLRSVIAEKVRQPLNPGNRKVIVFTAFADTAKYLYAELAPWAQTELGLHAALVTGAGHNQTTLPGVRRDLAGILTAFSPRSKERPADLAAEGDIDLLIATDCISEGQNLQDCDFLINYDIHWNPVRIIQRFGRIDRIGSPNARIQLVNFWPNIELEEYIKLEQRVSGRMVLLDVSATGEENLIEQQAGDRMNDLEYRRAQLLKLRDAVIDLEDLSSGVSIADLTLADFRLDLSRYRKAHPGYLESLPLGMFAVTNAPEAGLPSGIVFCLRAVGEAATKSFEPGYPLAPHYLVHVGDDGAVRLPFTQAKTVLDRLKRLCADRDVPDSAAYERFARATRDGADMAAARRLLASAVASVAGRKEESAVASLFSPGGTHALAGEFAGIDDFEVVSFLVVLPGDGVVAPQCERTELAVFTLKFQKPGDAPFSDDERQACTREGWAALNRLFASLAPEQGVKLDITYAGDGEGCFWVEFGVAALAVTSALGGPANTLHILGAALERWGGGYEPKLEGLQKTGRWLQHVAWRLTPQPGQDPRRPGCFGVKKQLDRRTRRCRDCGFLGEWVQRGASA
jgi:SNF2 family DNA or RNA helicase